MDSVNYEINKFVLLTGAGFTRDFGGFLANEMWALIFNSPTLKDYPRIKSMMLNDFNYESIYYKVIDGKDFNEDEKNALTEVVFSSYKRLDDSVRNYRNLGTKQPVDINAVSKSIERFTGSPAITDRNNSKGFFFTLNQDLLVERYFSNLGLVTPYVNQPTIEIYQDKEYNESTCSRTLPATDTDLGKTNSLSSSKFFYVKLHGSWNWYSSDGKKKLVIGRDKINQINDEPVLKRYFGLFKETLLQKNVRLFVIGYGFGDEHINEIIADSIKNNNLRLYVLNSLNPEKFKNDLHKDKPYGERIWGGLEGYYPYSLSQVFPGTDTVEYQLIQDSYFNS
jgi:hypothetical protein